MIQSITSSFFATEALNKIINKIPNYISDYKNEILISLTVAYIFLFFFLLIWVMYSIGNIDNMYKDKQRLSLLNRLLKIWDYPDYKQVSNGRKITNISQILKLEDRHQIFTDLTFTKTAFEKKIEKSIGDTTEDNFWFFTNGLIVIMSKIGIIFDWFLSFFMSGTMFLVSIILIKQMETSQPLFVRIIYWLLTVALIFLFLVFYMSQLNVYSKDVQYEKRDSSKKYVYRLSEVERNIGSRLIMVSYISILVIVPINTYTKFVLLMILLLPFPVRVQRVEVIKENTIENNMLIPYYNYGKNIIQKIKTFFKKE